jgi:hypothetical protein
LAESGIGKTNNILYYYSLVCDQKAFEIISLLMLIPSLLLLLLIRIWRKHKDQLLLVLGMCAASEEGGQQVNQQNRKGAGEWKIVGPVEMYDFFDPFFYYF